MTRVRMKLAEGGLPKGGGVGYEIFDKSDTLGATSFVQNINHLRALEGELARTIKAIDRVQAARVHLVLPERPLFSRDKVEPSASIVLKVRGALEAQQVRAIRHLVASAVNGLKPQRVSIVDEAGQLLADGAADCHRRDRRRRPRSARRASSGGCSDQIESIVSSVVGPGRARVQLSAEFDFNRITETFDKFDPEGRVLRSSQTREESDRQRQQGRPGDRRQRAARRASSGQQASRRSRSATRARSPRRSSTTRSPARPRPRSPKAGGSSASRRPCWSTAATPRTTRASRSTRRAPRKSSTASPRWCAPRSASTRSAATRSRSSTCASPKRPSMPIQEPTGWLCFLQFTKDDIMRAIELAVMALLGLVVVLFVVRPLVRRILTPEAPRPAGAPGGAPAHRGTARTPRSPTRRCRCVDQPDRQDDRHGAGAGPGARPIDPEGRRARRTQSARDRLHHPPMAARDAPDRMNPWPHAAENPAAAATRSPILSRRSRAARAQRRSGAPAHAARSAPRC